MIRVLSFALLVAGCVPAAVETPASPIGTSQQPAERGDPCHKDIPDCEAACALRETGRSSHLEWFDRRCAAVILGTNPDKAVAYVPPAAPLAGGDSQAAPEASDAPRTGMGAPLPSTRQLPPGTLDPFGSRSGVSGEPVECTAARTLRTKGKLREADVLSALCSAKGGVESKETKEPNVGF